MKPPPFDYVLAESVADAVRLLADTEREAKVLAGGQSLIPMLNMRLARPEVLVDITRIEDLRAIRVEDGHLRIGAGVRQSTVLSTPEARQGWPLLTAAIEHIGHPQIRNRGTVCGSLVHHDPAAELPTVAVALDARLTVAGPRGNRTIAAEDFFVGMFQTALEPDELLTEVIFPPLGGEGYAFEEIQRTHGAFATVGVAVHLSRPARIVFCGVGSTPVRVTSSAEELDPHGDIHASAAYRRDAARALLERAMEKATKR
jgi:carbon-monoxide dehydrogenase medium subunit